MVPDIVHSLKSIWQQIVKGFWTAIAALTAIILLACGTGMGLIWWHLR